MTKCDAIFYKGGDPLSTLIKRITGGKYSHCGLLINGIIVVDTDIVRSYQPRILPWKIGDYDVISLDLTDDQMLLAEVFINNNMNTPYSLWENIRYLLKFGDDNKHAMNCVEALYDFIQFVNGNLNDSDKYMSPSELYKLLGGEL